MIRGSSSGRHFASFARRAQRRCQHGHLIQPYSGNEQYHFVLDLDETLIHSPALTPKVNFLGRDRIEFNLGGQYPQHIVTYIRPFARELVDLTARLGECLVWTAGTPDYADCIVSALDPRWKGGKGERRRVRHLVARDSRWFREGPYTKDLSRLDRNMERVLLLDNSPPIVHKGQGAHVVVVPNFMGQYRDEYLPRLADLLTDLTSSRLAVPEFLQQAATRGQLHFADDLF
eukprot:Hpha_TRINITY_DN33758_c0_g1::TRINITY_DN33758_c0_g1_i1::g.25046::m.25046